MANDHDTSYRQLFAHPELVRDLLAGFTPFACFRDLDALAFQRVNASYVSERNSQRHDDMVWRVQLDDEWLYVYLLLEFQSDSDRWMALRMQVYLGLLYQDLVKQHRLSPQGGLPPVLPLVFYNGAAPWSAHAELADLVMPAPDGLEIFQARQRYQLIDQHAFDPAALAGQKNLVAALFLLELSDTPDVLVETVAALSLWLQDPAQVSLRRSISGWIERLQRRQSRRKFIPRLQEEDAMGERYLRKYETWYDAVKDQGLQAGLQKGREEGREEGRTAGMRATLKRQLGQRFGALPADTLAFIDGAGQADVERWLDRVLTAPSPAGVFADPT
jgi:hypothetical protein